MVKYYDRSRTYAARIRIIQRLACRSKSLLDPPKNVSQQQIDFRSGNSGNLLGGSPLTDSLIGRTSRRDVCRLDKFIKPQLCGRCVRLIMQLVTLIGHSRKPATYSSPVVDVQPPAPQLPTVHLSIIYSKILLQHGFYVFQLYQLKQSRCLYEI